MASRVSIIIPVYRVEKYLSTCLDSVLEQTFQDWEAICVDDGSPDNCGQILDDYAKKDKRFVIVHQPNGGYGRAVNHGLDVAQGEYVGIVEPDDWIEPKMFESLYQKAIETDADFVKSDFYKYRGINNTNEVAHVLPSEVANSTIRPRDYMSVLATGPCIWTTIYKKEFLDANKIRFLETPGASYQDTGFHYKNLLMANKAYFMDQPFYHYRTDNATSSVKDMKKVFCVCDEWAEIIRWCKERGFYDEVSGLLCALQYNTYMWNWKRLNGSMRNLFLQRFSKEFKDLEGQGVIEEKYFSQKNYGRLKQIIHHPRIFSFMYDLKHFPHKVAKKLKG